MNKVMKITLDFEKNLSYTPYTFVQNDYETCKIKFNIVQDITDKTVKLTYQLPSGNTYVEDATALTTNSAEIELSSDALLESGKINCQVALYDGLKRLTNEVVFYYNVKGDLADGGTVANENSALMTTEIYDPDLIQNDVFDMANMKESTTEKIFTITERNKLNGIEENAEVNNISDLNATDLTDGGETSLHMHDNRYYTETETDNLLDDKVDKVAGKELSDNNYSDADKNKVDYISVTQNIDLDDHENRIDKLENNLNVIDTSGSPGNETLIQGDEVDGLFGFVQAADFIDGDALASELGITEGTSYKPNSTWAKVMVGGEIGFFPLLPLRYSIPWDAIYYAGAVHGDGSIGVLPPEGRLGTELEITNGTTITTTGHFLGGKSSANDYYDDVGSAGDTIVLSGWDNAGNNGEFTIDTITDSTITIIEGGLTAEVGDRDSKLWPKANEVLQDAEVTIDGLTYKVRLFKGFDEDPINSYADSDRGAVGAGSEWNRIVLPLHERAVAQNWNYTAYAGTTENWNTGLSDEDMILHNQFGSGSYRWCQEVRDDDQSFRRGYRGRYGASYASADVSWSAASGIGWCPLLILKNS